MIMVLSCCDLLAVIACHPTAALIALLLFKKKLGTHLTPRWVETLAYQRNIFCGVSLLALLVMNLDQHLATYRPIFHRTSVTKKKLLILLVILIIIQGTLEAISIRHFAISEGMKIITSLKISRRAES